jgi:hypothetical protein
MSKLNYELCQGVGIDLQAQGRNDRGTVVQKARSFKGFGPRASICFFEQQWEQALQCPYMGLTCPEQDKLVDKAAMSGI